LLKSVVWIINAAVVIVLLLALSMSSAPRPSQALPELSRRYGVPCSACHTVAPQLNTFGLAYQANHFNWPGGEPPAYHTGLSSIPISGIITGSSTVSNSSLSPLTFDSLDFFEVGGVKGGPLNGSGYFVDLLAATPPDFTWTADLNDAYFSVPILNSKYSITVGQFAPLQYQYDAVNSLTVAPQLALYNTVGDFSASGASPGVRVDYFSNRGSFKPDGVYVDAGVSTTGHLSLTNDETRIGSAQGGYLHVFKRTGYNSLGVFGYENGDSRDLIVLGTLGVHDKIFVTASGSSGHDQFGSSNLASLQGEYALSSRYAGTIQGNYNGQKTYPVFSLTAYPFDDRSFRIIAESIQAPGNRNTQIVLKGQF